MLATVTSGAILGVEALLVRVEVDLGRGLPAIHVVGLPESSVREGRERVVAALANTGFGVPPCRITINLAPADIRKDGSAFDLPLAIGLLAAAGEIDGARLRGLCVAGELGLDGTVRPVRGALPLAFRCRASGVATIVVPPANGAEAALIEGLRVLAPASLRELIAHLRGERPLPALPPTPLDASPPPRDVDLAEVRGQEQARRALEIAAAGRHNVLFVGPPGSGKSMLARRMPGILPPATREQALEITTVYSVAGRLDPQLGLVRTRPFRAPHHTISDAGLVGGGSIPRPGEISLAHHGVLFLDELPEFRRHVLDALRQPLEEGCVRIGRARHVVRYPARFVLVAAMNPCPCGHYGAPGDRCACSAAALQRYHARISGPLLDRIDLHVEVPTPSARQLSDAAPAESSEAVRARTCVAAERQALRLRGTRATANGDMSPREIRESCRLDGRGENLLKRAFRDLGLSARAWHRILRVARTIADLARCERVEAVHVAEAIQYRALDRPLRAPERV